MFSKVTKNSGFELNIASSNTQSVMFVLLILVSCFLLTFVLKNSKQMERGLLFNYVAKSWLFLLVTSWFVFFCKTDSYLLNAYPALLLPMWLSLSPNRSASMTNWGFLVFAVSCLPILVLSASQGSPTLIFSSLEVLTFLVILSLLVVRHALEDKQAIIVYLWPSALSGVFLFIGLMLSFKPVNVCYSIDYSSLSMFVLKSTFFLMAYSLKVGLFPSGLWLREFYTSLGYGGLLVYLGFFYIISILLVVKLLSVVLSLNLVLVYFVNALLLYHVVMVTALLLEPKISSVFLLGTAASSPMILAVIVSLV